MTRKSFVLMVMGTVVFFLCSASSADVPQLINYQGKLTTATGGCLNDTVSMTFTIYSDDQGTELDWTEDQDSVIVKEGIFDVLLGSEDPIPASVFDGSTKYLGVQVESDSEMRPLKPMVSVAYAYRAGTADAGIGGWVDDGTVVRLNTGTDSVGIGTSSPDAKLHIEGTLRVTDKANIGPYNTNTGENAFVAGCGNDASGDNSTVSGGGGNIASANWSTVAGGDSNIASGDLTVVGGGMNNTASGSWGSTVGGGYHNIATSVLSTVGGGGWNTASGDESTVGGGGGNTASGYYSTVGGGTSNIASDYYATVGGGRGNLASGQRATVGGGYHNTASGEYATAPGGYADTAAGDYSVAAGRQVRITSDGDHTFAFGRNFTTSTPNAVIFHNSVDPIKVGIGTTSPQGALDVSSTTGAFIVPRMTTAQRNALTAVNGMIIYNTTDNQFNFYENGAWVTK